MGPTYPATLDVDPPVKQSRLTVFFRLIFAIPIAIFVALVGIAALFVWVAAWFVILFTGNLPQGMAEFLGKSLKLGTRVNGYIYLLTDKYPAFSMDDDAAYPVHAGVVAQLEGRNRLTVLFRLIMILPHAIILYFLQVVLRIVGLFAWVAALVTGSVPLGLHGFIAGMLRWQHRVSAYAFLLTDEYPPFSLS